MHISSDAVPPSVLADLRRRHAQPHRAYHTGQHIAELLDLLDRCRSAMLDPLAVELAILFHDAVYDPAARDNEEQSARLLESVMTGAAPADSLYRAAAMVRATALHAVPDGLPDGEREDLARFLDMDLAILAAPAARFDEYEAQVRREYAHVADDAFRTGRAAVLRRFLSRDRLYLSDWGREQFESAARTNCARSLARLDEA